MEKDHKAVVQSQFNPQASAYVTSAVHASGPDLAGLEAFLSGKTFDNALDMGAGGGHVSYLLASNARQVTAVDISVDMLAAITATTQARGLRNIATREGAAEALPFDDASFDLIACRYSAHHWNSLAKGLSEARRVLKKGAPALFIDVMAPDAAYLDSHLQAVELLRDTSHSRDYRFAEWAAALEAAALQVTGTRRWRIRMDFPVWTARMSTPQLQIDAIRALQLAASKEIRDYFEIEADGSFTMDVTMIETTAV